MAFESCVIFDAVHSARSPLRSRERMRLRLLVDHAVRERIRWQDEPRCIGCGVELRDRDTGMLRYSGGCRSCSDRRCKHQSRNG
jgi:hypothetical protein